MILCGVRDVRDYVVYSSSAGGRVNTGSCFNIKAESLRLGDFTQEETRSLLGQHTAETGQQFAPPALQRIWELTAGQPWLINALAYQVCFRDKTGRDRNRPVTDDALERAKEALILQRVTHLDQLANTLSQQRVRRVIEPLLDGDIEPDASDEDILYVRDLGLIARDDPVRMANPIYAEVVPCQLTTVLQGRLLSILRAPSYVRSDGALDMDRLMRRFQGFFRDHPEHWVSRFGYLEAGPQLILQAALQTVVNSGGRIEREYGLGRRRTDLLVLWRLPDGRAARYVIECKVVRRGRGLEAVVAQGVRQTAEYMDACGAEAGHLAVFDLREGRTWAQSLFRRRESSGGRTVTVWGV